MNRPSAWRWRISACTTGPYGASLDYFGALAGNRWVYADSRTGGLLTYQIAGIDTTFKPGQALLQVVIASSSPSLEYWQERDGQLLIHGRTETNGATIRYEPAYIAARYCLEVGQRWETTTTRTAGPGSRPQVVRYSFTVEGTETIATPSGTYPAFRIRRQDTDTADGSTRETVIWFSPYFGLTRQQTPDGTIEVRGTSLH